MTYFQDLFTLAAADLEQVGDKARTLAQLRHWGLPVLPTWVLKADSWRAFVKHVGQAEANGDGLSLQQVARRLRHQLQQHPVALDWSSLRLSVPLMLRSSLGLRDDRDRCLPLPQAFQGMLAGQICADQPNLQHLKQAWAQALSAQNLRLCQHHGFPLQRLHQLSLTLMAQPVAPAAFSGTLLLADQQAWLEVVAGLGVVHSQGEAIPACCHVDGSYHYWQSGHQERSYYLDSTSGEISWQWRPEPKLTSPLSQLQVNQLVQLGQQVQRRLGKTVRLEWLLEQPAGMEFVMTQAAAWQLPEADSAVETESEVPAVPDLPTIQAAIRGIPAAAGRGLAPALVIKDGSQLPDQLPPGCIVVAQDIQPDLFSRAVDVVGIVIEGGSATCHAAILARERGIPAVVGAPLAASLIDTGNPLWLDGDKGMVYIVSEVKPAWRPQRPARQGLKSGDVLPTRTQVMANLSQATRLTDYVAAIDGVGLVRSEWLLLEGLKGRHPQSWIEAGQARDLESVIVERLRPILEACPDQPVRYRSLDLRSHEWTQLQGSPPREVNPMLGLRGTFSYEQDPRLFQTELAALAVLQREGYEHLELILPFVRTVEEVQACQRQIAKTHLAHSQSFRLWMMAEVPSVLFLLPAYVKAGIQGIVIGTNDLTQLLLGVDREQPLLAAGYDERQPAVLAALQYLIRQAQLQGIGCSLCGQAPVRFPELIDLLVGWEIDSICVELAAIEATRQAIAAAEA